MSKSELPRSQKPPGTPIRYWLIGLSLLGHSAANAQLKQTEASVEVHTKSEIEEGKSALKANTTRIGKGLMELRDIPQSLTVITEKLLDDRNLDTLKEALKQSAGVSFQAAEGSEEDIRIRGFSLQSTGDIFIDGMRDPAFYERDSFNWIVSRYCAVQPPCFLAEARPAVLSIRSVSCH